MEPPSWDSGSGVLAGGFDNFFEALAAASADGVQTAVKLRDADRPAAPVT